MNFSSGMVYKHGTGVPADPAKAIGFFRTAAEQGHEQARLQLGLIYMTGDGVDRDVAEALKWFRLAAEGGSPRGRAYLGNMYQLGMGVVADVAEAKRLYLLAAEDSDPLAQLLMGALYSTGNGVPRDQAEAVKWYRLSANQGEMRAQHFLGVHYSNGEGVEKDDAEGARWIRRAAEQGHASSQGMLSAMYRDGLGVERDLVRAYAWAVLAVKSEVPRSRALQAGLEKEMTAAQIVEARRIASEFKAEVWTEAKRDDVRGAGVGFFVTTDGFFVTNHRVIAGAAGVKVRTASGTRAAEVVAADAENDVAILKVEGEFRAVPVLGSGGLGLSERVAVFEFPEMERGEASTKYYGGKVVALTGPGGDPQLVGVAISRAKLIRGGPLFDESGGVVGLVESRSEAVDRGGESPAGADRVCAIRGTIVLAVIESVPGLREKLLPAAEGAPRGLDRVAREVGEACAVVIVER